MDKKYAGILRQYPVYAEAAQALQSTLTDDLAQLTAQVTAPVLFTYVWYVLRQAERIGLHRLYFLARDGYVMLGIAREIARACPVSLELRYLCCSRASLRMPSYHRIGTEEAMDLLLHRGTNLTVRHILDRAALTASQREALYAAIGFDAADEQTPLDEPGFAGFCDTLRHTALFRQMVMENSVAAYDAAIGYFEQEGLMDGTSFGIVDTGWTGSMQRSLRQLSDRIPPINGFYFGMYARPQAAEDGVYHTWYFSHRSPAAVITKFNNNVFECMCAAPHGMTTGYRQTEKQRFEPVMKAVDSILAANSETQIRVCQEFAALCAPKIRYHAFEQERMHRITRQLLTGLMSRTDSREARAFGNFPFCDDVTESYTDTLVQTDCEQALREHLFVRRVIRRLRGQKPSRELYWSYGTLAVSALPLKSLCRPALRCWDVVRCWGYRLKSM